MKPVPVLDYSKLSASKQHLALMSAVWHFRWRHMRNRGGARIVALARRRKFVRFNVKIVRG